MTGGRKNTIVLITDSSFSSLDTERSVIAGAGAHLDVANCRSEDDVIAASEGATALLVQFAPVGRRLFEVRPEVRLIVRYGIGLDNIELGAAAEHGVAVAHVPDYCIEEVAEHTVALLMATHRRLNGFDRAVRDEHWADIEYAGSPMRSLSQMIVGMIGFGRVGQRTAEMLSNIADVIRVYDPLAKAESFSGRSVERVRDLGGLAGCDVLTLHCPLTVQTRHIVDEIMLRQLSPGALVINTARGALVEHDALVQGLRSGHLGGVGLDTFENEPLPPTSPLLALPNVLVTPHVAWLSEAARARLQREVALEAARFLRGEPLRCPATADFVEA